MEQRRKLSTNSRTDTSYTKLATERPAIYEEHPRIKDTVGVLSQPMFQHAGTNLMSIDSNEGKQIQSDNLQIMQTPATTQHDQSYERRINDDLTINDLQPSQQKYRFNMNHRASHNSTSTSGFQSELIPQPLQNFYQCEPPVVSKRQKKHKKDKKDKKEKKHRRHKGQSSTSSLIESSQQTNLDIPLNCYQIDYSVQQQHTAQFKSSDLPQKCFIKYKFDQSVQTAKGQNMSQQSQADYVKVHPLTTQHAVHQSQSQLSSEIQSNNQSPHRHKRQRKEKKEKKHRRKHHDSPSRQAPQRSVSPTHSQASSVANSTLLELKYAAQQNERHFDEKVRSLKDEIKESLAEIHLSQAKALMPLHVISVQSAATATVNNYRVNHQRSLQARAEKLRQENTTNQTAYTVQTVTTEPNANAQRYLKWLERNSQQSRDRESGRESSKQKDDRALQEKQENRELKRHKSVENVKQYCILKLLGKLDTREQLQIVSQNSIEESRKVDEQKYRSKYSRASDEIYQRRQISRAKDRLKEQEEELRRQQEIELQRKQQVEEQKRRSKDHREMVQSRNRDHSRNNKRLVKTTHEEQQLPRDNSRMLPKNSSDYLDANLPDPSREASKRSDIYVNTTAQSSVYQKPPLPDSKNTYSFRPMPQNIYENTEDDRRKQFSFNGSRQETSGSNLTSQYVPSSIHNQPLTSLEIVYQPIHPYVHQKSPSMSSQQEPSNHYASIRHGHNQHSSYYTLGQVQNSLTQMEQIEQVQLRVPCDAGTSSSSTLAKWDAAIHSEEVKSEMTEEQRNFVQNQAQMRIEQLKLQTAEIQKIPDRFNERVQFIKQRTAQITQQASPFRSKSRDLNQTQPDQNELRQSENSNSFVKQHDLSSTFLRDMQLNSKLNTMESGIMNTFKSKIINESKEFGKQPEDMLVNAQSRNFENRNLSGMVQNLQREIEYQQINTNDEPSTTFVQGDVSDSRQSRHERKTKRKLRHERQRMLRKMRERGVFIPPEVEAQVEQSLLNSHSELGSCTSQSFPPPSERLMNDTSQTQQTSFLRKDEYTSTRKQLMYLMAIQNEHSRLLQQIQMQGDQKIGQEQSDKLNLASANLMMQIQAIFSHLQDIQSKLEYHQLGNDQIQAQEQSIQETVLEQSENDRLTDEDESQPCFVDVIGQPEQVHVQLVPVISRLQRNDQKICTKQDQKIAGDDTLRLIENANQRQFIKNAYSKQNGNVSHVNLCQSDNSKINASGNQFGLREHSDQTNSKPDMQFIRRDTFEIKRSFEQQTQESECERCESRPVFRVTDYSDYTRNSNKQFGTQSLLRNTFQTQSSAATGSDKMTDAFCQMLNSEVEKIKKESITQVNAMRDHYAKELQALREEFLAKELELNRCKQQTISFEQDVRQNHLESIKTATLHGSPRESQALLEELKNVKAERDTYYNKLVAVKEKLRTSSLNRDRKIESIRTSLSRERAQSSMPTLPQPETRVPTIYESEQMNSNNSTFAPRRRFDDSSRIVSNGVTSLESFAYPIAEEKSVNKKNDEFKTPTGNLMPKKPNFTVIAAKAQTVPQSHREPFNTKNNVQFVVSPQGHKLQQLSDPEEQAPTVVSEHEDDGGSIEKSFSHEGYMEQISNGHASSQRQSKKLRSGRKRSTGKRAEKRDLRSLSSDGSTRRSKSLSQRRQEAVSKVMSSGLPSTLVDQRAYGLKEQQTVPVLPTKTSLNQIGDYNAVSASNLGASSSHLGRSISPSIRRKRDCSNREVCRDSSNATNPCIPTISSAAESFKIVRPDPLPQKRSQSPIMIDFQQTNPSQKPANYRQDYTIRPQVVSIPRHTSVQVSEVNSLNVTQQLKNNFVQTAGTVSSHTRNAIYEPSGNQMNVSNSFGVTLSTQNLALTLKEKEISERISRIESFLRQQV